MAFQVAQGHNNTTGLADVQPQPRHSGILYPRVVIALDGSKYYDGLPYAIWRWDYLTRAGYAALKTQFGFSETTPSVPVTVRLLQNDFETYANYNAVAYLPDMGQQIEHSLGKFLNIEIVLRQLEALP